MTGKQKFNYKKGAGNERKINHSSELFTLRRRINRRFCGLMMFFTPVAHPLEAPARSITATINASSPGGEGGAEMSNLVVNVRWIFHGVRHFITQEPAIALPQII